MTAIGIELIMPGAAIPQLLNYAEIVDVDLDATNDVNFADVEDYGHRVIVEMNTSSMNNYLHWSRAAGSARPIAKLNSIYEAGFKMALETALGAGYVDIDGVTNGLHFGTGNLSTNPDSRIRKDGAVSANDIPLCFVLYKLYGSSAVTTLDNIYNLGDAHDMLNNSTVAAAITESFKASEAGALDTMFRDLLAADPHRFFNASGLPMAGIFETNADASGSGTWNIVENDILEVKLKLIFKSRVTRRGVAGREHNLTTTASEDGSIQENQQTIINPEDYFYIRLQLKSMPNAAAGGTASEIFSTVLSGAIENLGTSVTGSELKSFLSSFTASNPAPTPTVTVEGISVSSLITNSAGSFDSSATYDVNFVLLTDNSATINTDGLGENTVLYIPSTTGTTVTLIVDGVSYSVSTTSTTITLNGTTYNLGQKITLGNKSFLFAFSGSVGLVVQNATPGIAKMATRIGGDATYNYTTLVTDPSGNVYIRYRVTSTTAHTIYNYSAAPTSGGGVTTSVYGTVSGSTSYLVKYSASGVAQWAVPVPSAFDTFGDRVSDIVCDASNNIYVVGNAANTTLTLYNYSSAPVSGGAVGTSVYGTLALPSANQYYPNAYIIKYSASGSVVWATRTLVHASFAHEIQNPTVAVDKDNNVYMGFHAYTGGNTSITLYDYSSAPVAGGAIGTSVYGTYSAGGTSGHYAVCITKYSSAGTIQSVSALEPALTDGGWYNIGMSLKTDSAGSLYLLVARVSNTTVTVKSYSSAPVSGGAVGLSTYGTIAVAGNGGLLVKFNASGVAQWATQLNVSGAQTTRRPHISIDASDNVYAVGTLTASSGNSLSLFSHSSQPVGGGAIGTTAYGTLAAQGYSSTFIVKYNSSGAVQWATAIRGNENNVNRSVCDTAGNMYVIVYASNSVTPMNYSSAPVSAGAIGLATYGSIPYSGGSGNDIYLIKYKPDGTVRWATRVGGTLDDTSGGVDVHNDEHVYITGIYSSNPITISNFLAHPTAQGNVFLETYGTLPDVNVSAGNNIFLVKYGV